MLIINSALFYLGYFSLLIPHCSLCIILGGFMPLKTRYRYFLLWNRFAIWWLKVTCKVRVEVSGAQHVPAGPFVLLSNHQSPWETIYLYQAFCPISAILKRELLHIPFFGWSLRMLKPIAIDRVRKATALQQLLEQGTARLNEGLSVLVFPEGTRVKPGEAKKYSVGGAALAISAGRMILPLAHNAGKCWPPHAFLKKPGIVKVIIGKPIDPAGRQPRELTAEIERWTRQALAE